MRDVWHDADDSEDAVLLHRLDGVQDPSRQRRPRPPSARRRILATGVLVLLVIPLGFLLWIPSWPRKPSTNDRGPPATPDKFRLDPAFDASTPPQIRIYRWTVSEIPGPAPNSTRMVVNGRSPGPLIQVSVHDRILVYVTNGLANEGTSIHWHGLPQPDTPFYDGTGGISQCPIPPGATLLYNFTLGGWTGTTWWHGHTGMQHTDGLYGPLVVHAPDEHTSIKYESEEVITLSDVYGTPANTLLNTYLTSNPVETVPEPVPDSLLLNGRGGGAQDRDGGNADGYFEVMTKPGTSTRLRLINAGSFAPLRLSIDNHVLTIIEVDGTPVVPVRVRDLVLQPAQRYSVLVTATPDLPTHVTPAFWIRARMIDEKFAYENLKMEPEARAVLRYTLPDDYTPTSASELGLPGSVPGPPAGDAGARDWDSLPHFDEWTLRPLSAENDDEDANALRKLEDEIDIEAAKRRERPPMHADADLTIPFTFSIQRTHDQNWRSFINETSWEIPPPGEASLVSDLARVGGGEGNFSVKVWPGDQVIAALEYNRTVDFVITNLDDGDHPFHLHGYAPWLLGVGRGRYKPATGHLDLTSPMRRDTFTVPRRGWAVVRIVTDNPGYWAFHCHIAWHMMGGGLFQIAVPPAPINGNSISSGSTTSVPAAILEQCRMWG
ncbi:multi-copper oxidase [Mycena alexandri]|uniref:Multi-copper oxidase n=1 Tax=Mycena alexandri TaxID=1745969 RepID=A0AAD6S6F5_9AGAR|nr:multi-copper oxidase [Mycena alexandri]